MKKNDDTDVDWKDVQGLVLSGYKDLTFAAYIPWRFPTDGFVGESSKVWLRGLIPLLTRVAEEEEPANGLDEQSSATSLTSIKKRLKDDKSSGVCARNLALTWRGLKKLADDQELSLFSNEFREGMAPRPSATASVPRRCNILGDVGKNSPQHWEWGGWNLNKAEDIDGLLLLYAANEPALKNLIKSETQGAGVKFLQRISAAADPLILRGELKPRNGLDSSNGASGRGVLQDSEPPRERPFQEHFGFVDGISQPIIAGTRAASGKSPEEARISVVQPGEFVLGYRNERGARVGNSEALRRGSATKSKDLTCNGTYLVFRQLEQNVSAFNHVVNEIARSMGKDPSWVAARMVGRTKDGEPLIPPSLDEEKGRRTNFLGRISQWIAGRRGSGADPETKRNDFLYYFEDRFGLSCPLGAHIRRANPRDTVIGPDPDLSLRLSKMHRILRRGRPYGPRLSKGSTAEVQDEQCGMLFICLNADIVGQFETIQHSWINYGRFGGLYSETDPLMNYPGEDVLLTIQRRPTSEIVLRSAPTSAGTDRARGADFEQFVTVRGGAYFFLPGIEALKRLAG
jgi:Dyp-type peroxidase family